MKSVGKGGIEERGKGKYRLRVSVAYDNGDKSRLEKNVSCRNKTEARRLLESWRMELLSSSGDVRRDGLTLGEYLNEYLEYCRDGEGLSPSTIRGYRDIMKNRFHGALTSVSLIDLKPYMIEEHYLDLRKNGGRSGRPLSGSSIQKAHSFLKTALKRAVILEYILVNPCERVKSPSMSKSKSTALDENEVRRMLALLCGHPDNRFSMAVRLALATGMRRGEVCGLQWQDVDFDNAEISVVSTLVEVSGEDSKNGETLEPKDTKTDSSDRKIAIDGDTLLWLKKHKVDQYHLLAYFESEQSEETPVVGGQFGEWYRPSHFTSEFAAFRQQHRFDIRLHDLRHTQASLLIKNGESIVTVSKRLGHAKVSTTLDIYSHMMPGQDKGAAEKIGNIFTAKVT